MSFGDEALHSDKGRGEAADRKRMMDDLETTYKLMPTDSPRSVAISLHDSHLSRPIFLPTNSFLSMVSAGVVV